MPSRFVIAFLPRNICSSVNYLTYTLFFDPCTVATKKKERVWTDAELGIKMINRMKNIRFRSYHFRGMEKEIAAHSNILA